MYKAVFIEDLREGVLFHVRRRWAVCGGAWVYRSPGDLFETHRLALLAVAEADGRGDSPVAGVAGHSEVYFVCSHGLPVQATS